MNRQEFLTRLDQGLSGLPRDRSAAVKKACFCLCEPLYWKRKTKRAEKTHGEKDGT